MLSIRFQSFPYRVRAIRRAARIITGAALLTLTLLPGLARAEAGPRCYDPANAGGPGKAGWTGCEGDYIVRDRSELVAISAPNTSIHEHDGVTYTFADGPHTLFTGQVTRINDIFTHAPRVDIGHWDTSRVTTMRQLFYRKYYDGDLSGWDTSNVTDMRQMFHRAQGNPTGMENWNVSNVRDFSQMFDNNYTFNRDISGWDTSGATNMEKMFFGTSVFNQDLSGWDVRQFATMPRLFDAAVRDWTNPDWKPQRATAGATAPVVTGVLGLTADGYYGEGETIEIAVDFDMPVTVDTTGGLPRISLDYIYVPPPIAAAYYLR